MFLTHKMKKQKRRRLGANLTMASIIFTICICLGLGGTSVGIYYKSVINQYEKYISGILNIMSENIDADDLQQCINTQKESPKYKKSQEFMNQLKASYDIKYICILEPLNKSSEDNVMYIMSGVGKEKNGFDNVTLGEFSGKEYDEEMADYYISAMQGKNIVYHMNKSKSGYTYTGILPIKNSQNESVALLCAGVSAKDIDATLIKYVKVFVLAAIINAVLFFISLYLWLRKRVIDPIQKLEASTKAFIKSSHVAEKPSQLKVVNPEINSQDEMQTLSESLVVVANDIKHYMTEMIQKTKEKERIASELNVATHIQASMLPCIFPPFPDRPEFDIYASMEPAKEVGGDFYDFFMIDETHLAVVVADVSGKGVPAALFMVIGKTLIKDYSGFGNSLGEVFSKVNEILCESNKEELFITAFEGVLDLETGELEFVNAGHEKPIIYRKEENKWEIYPTRAGFVLAGMEGMTYHSGKLNLKKGDRLFLYTDGVPEAVNLKNEQYGMDRFMQILENNTDSDLKNLIKNVRKDVSLFADSAEQFDDITMLCMEYKQEM